MNRSEYAAQMWTLLDKCEACLRHRAYTPTNMPDFSHFDKPRTNQAEQPTTAQNVTPMANTTPKPTTPETRQIIDLATEIAGCRKCSLAANTQHKVPGQGAIPAKIMVVSFYTDDNAEKTMFPMSGNILSQFQKWLSAIQINLQDVYVTNLIKCNPHNNGINKNYIENCMFYLDNEIQIIRPKIILTLGSTVVSSLCQKYVDINAYHGQILNYRGFIVFPTYHPNDVISNPFLRKPVWDDLQKFKAVYERMLSDPNVRIE